MPIPAEHQIGIKRADGGETVVQKTDSPIPRLSDIFPRSTAPQPSSDGPSGWAGMRPSANIEDRRGEPPLYGNETRPFKTTVVPSRKHGGAISDGTRAMLAKLRKH